MRKKIFPPTPAGIPGEPEPVPPPPVLLVGQPPAEVDPVMAQADGAQALVASMPHNALKANDFGRDSALNPPIGLASDSQPAPLSASTLSEVNSYMP